MLNFDHIRRVAIAAVGALVLTTVSVGAAVGPGHNVSPAQTVYAAVHTDQANG